MMLIVLCPLISFIILFFVGSILSRVTGIYMCLMLMACDVYLSLMAFLEMTTTLGPLTINLGTFISVGDVKINLSLLFDSLTVSMLMMVVLMSFLVHLFSINYMYQDPFLLKFLSYLSLFTFFMLILMTSGNFFQLFLGWEGVGLASYLLINFWFTSLQANKSAIKAVIVNSMGDFCLYFAILLMFYNFKTLDFNIVFCVLNTFNKTMFMFLGLNLSLLDIISLFLFLAAAGKSAQLGLHTWLPDAMEGPTPVSALMHAATMVTAGIFVLMRCSFFLECSDVILSLITCVGAMTIIFSSTAGFFQFDIKKMMAYSTCSQLGYMVFACGNSQYNLALYHLFNHAFFKALLFLGAGSVIHAMLDEQDISKMGGLWRLLPMSYISFLMGSLSLMGLPFLTGFYSKDLILEIAQTSFKMSSIFGFYLALTSVLGTAYYSTSLMYYVFFNNLNITVNVNYIKESPVFTMFVLLTLCILSLIVGFFFKDVFMGFGNDLWYCIYLSPQHMSFFEEEFMPFLLSVIPFFFTVCGMSLALLVNDIYYIFNLVTIKVNSFFGAKWFFDIMYNELMVLKMLNFAHEGSFKLLDSGLMEKLGSMSAFRKFKLISRSFINFQTGFLYHYFLMIMLGLMMISFYAVNNFMGLGFSILLLLMCACYNM